MVLWNSCVEYIWCSVGSGKLFEWLVVNGLFLLIIWFLIVCVVLEVLKIFLVKLKCGFSFL